MTQKNPLTETTAKRKTAVVTLGCRVNQYESRAIAERLENAGVTVTETPEPDCDSVIINTCAVTAESERKSRQTIRRMKKLCPAAGIIVTGCYAQLRPDKAAAIPGVTYVCGNEKKMDCAEHVLCRHGSDDEARKTENLIFSGNYENYRVLRPDHTRAYVKIEDGCENKCAYCIIPEVRGPVRSKAPEDVYEEVRDLCENGFREIVLTGIETCSYGYGLTELINRLSSLQRLERIRLSSVNPAKINRAFTDSVSDNPKLCPHFHLSLQSCCDKILNGMKRQYNVRMITENCDYMREKIRNVCFTADMICGFPGETDDDFAETLKNVSRLRLLFAHIFPYSDRPGTAASAMPQKVPAETAEARCAELRKAVGISRNTVIESFISSKTPLRLLVEKYRNGFVTGHTENFIETSAAVSKDIKCGEILNIHLVNHEASRPFDMPESVVF